MDENNNKKAVVFFGTVTANSQITLISPLITDPYEVVSIDCKFALNCAGTLKLRFFLSPDDSTPTDEKPTGFNILEEYGQVDYLAGDDETKHLSVSATRRERNSFLKVYGENNDGFDHTIDAIMTIKII